ncbi:MAG: D-alanyl-D-alanine carboxypeptidase family protein [Candidatus Levyibacteriota bacterium]
MRHISGLFIAGIFCFFLIAGFLAYTNLVPSDNTLKSPLPAGLLKYLYPAQSKVQFWMPSIKAGQKVPAEKPELFAKSALSYDLTTNTMVLAKDIDDKLPIASLTKIMTAIVALETQKETDQITVSERAASIGEDSMGLSEGEKVSLRDLLYGLFLQSGNDAAEAIADSSQFGRDDFVHLMNKKAESLGLSSTHFTNPSGLEGDGKQYSTAHDLLVLTRYALEKDTIRNIVATYNYSIPYTSTHKAFDLYNETNLLTSYPGVKGVKTGYTDEAGLCLITYLERNGHKIIAVLLNSPDRRDEMIKILDYTLSAEGIDSKQG